MMSTDSSPLSGGGGGFSYRPPRRGMSQPGINYILLITFYFIKLFYIIKVIFCSKCYFL